MAKASAPYRIVQCPTCGSGVEPCPGCGGKRSAMWLMGRTFVWDRKVDRWHIAEEKLQRGLHRGFNAVLIVFGLVGLGLLVWQVMEQKVALDLTSITQFLGRRSAAHFTIALSFLGDLIVISRLVKARQQRQLVAHRESDLLAVPAPSLAWQDLIRQPVNVVEISGAFLDAAHRAIEGAWLLAERFHHAEVVPLHLFAALFALHDTQVVFGRLGVSSKSLSDRVSRALSRIPQHEQPPRLGSDVTSALLRAYLEAVLAARPVVDVT